MSYALCLNRLGGCYKCCDEEAVCLLIKEKSFKNRYQCSNCKKYFGADKEWLQAVKKVKKTWWIGGLLITGSTATYHLLIGNPEEAVATIAEHLNLDGNDDNSTTA